MGLGAYVFRDSLSWYGGLLLWHKRRERSVRKRFAFGLVTLQRFHIDFTVIQMLSIIGLQKFPLSATTLHDQLTSHSWAPVVRSSSTARSIYGAMSKGSSGSKACTGSGLAMMRAFFAI